MKKQYRFKRYCRSLLIVKVGYPILYGIVAHSVQQLSFFPVQAWIGFFQFGNTVTDTASTGSGERNKGFAFQVMTFNECVDDSWSKVPPDRIADKNDIISGNVRFRCFKCRTGLGIVHLY